MHSTKRLLGLSPIWKINCKETIVMKKTLYTLLVLLFSVSAFAQSAEWNSAVEAYSEGKYEEAANAYLSIEKSGEVSPELFYNLGNTYYRANKIGKAVLYYERALKLDPSNKDAQNNLQLARLKTLDKIDAVPEFVLLTWIKNIRSAISSDGWAVVSLVLLALALMLMLLYLFSRRSRIRKLFFILAVVCFFITLVSFLFSLALASNARESSSAVVVESLGSVRSSPQSGGNSIFILHEGTKMKVLENVGEWYKIEIEDGRQGWIKAGDVEII